MGGAPLHPPCLQMRNISCCHPNPLQFLVFDSETADEPVSHVKPHVALKTVAQLLPLFLCFWCDSPQWARASSFTSFLDHTRRCTTVGRTPVDEGSTRRRDLYLTTHNRQISMPPVGFEPIISAGERLHTYVLGRGYIGARTDTTQQTNICLGIHHQTCGYI